MKQYFAIAFLCALLIGCNKQAYKTDQASLGNNDLGPITDEYDDDQNPQDPYPGPGQIPEVYAMVAVTASELKTLSPNDSFSKIDSSKTHLCLKEIDGILHKLVVDNAAGIQTVCSTYIDCKLLDSTLSSAKSSLCKDG